MNARPILAIALIGASPAAAQARTYAPYKAQISYQAFADAAVACAEAAQKKAIATDAIEQRGWRAYPLGSKLPAGTTSFKRPGADVLVLVGKRPPLCTAYSFVQTSSGPESVFSRSDNRIATELKQAFGPRAVATDAQSQGWRKLRRFSAGDAIVAVSMFPWGVSGAKLEIAAINKHNLAGAAHTEFPRTIADLPVYD